MPFNERERTAHELVTSSISIAKKGAQKIIEGGYTVLPKGIRLRESAMLALVDGTTAYALAYGAVQTAKGGAILASHDYTGFLEIFQGGSVLVLGFTGLAVSLGSREILNSRQFTNKS